jgi:hypothetical protein
MSIFIVENDGQKNTYLSPILQTSHNINNNNSDPPPIYRDVYQDIIEIISYKAGGLGLFSSKRIGVDELDEKKYADSEEKLRTRSVKYSETVDIYFPYNNIICHDMNMWKFKCLEKDFWIRYNIIPYTSHDIPTILNFKRSNGDIQRGRIDIKEGLVIKRLENFDDKYNLYVLLHFNKEENDNIEDDDTHLVYQKLVPIETLVEINPNFNNINFEFQLFTESEINEEEENVNIGDKRRVMEHFDNNYIKWINQTVKPILIKLENNLTHSISFIKN